MSINALALAHEFNESWTLERLEALHKSSLDPTLRRVIHMSILQPKLMKHPKAYEVYRRLLHAEDTGTYRR